MWNMHSMSQPCFLSFGYPGTDPLESLPFWPPAPASPATPLRDSPLLPSGAQWANGGSGCSPYPQALATAPAPIHNPAWSCQAPQQHHSQRCVATPACTAQPPWASPVHAENRPHILFSTAPPAERATEEEPAPEEEPLPHDTPRIHAPRPVPSTPPPRAATQRAMLSPPKPTRNAASAAKSRNIPCSAKTEPMPQIPPMPSPTVEGRVPKQVTPAVLDTEDLGQKLCLCMRCEESGVVAPARASGVGARRRAQRARGTQAQCAACDAAVRGKPPPRLSCSFYLSMRHEQFDLVPIIIGRRGSNTRKIAEETGAKVRVRGKGSGHHEATGREAATPLMLAVTTDGDNDEGFLDAVEQATRLLRCVEERYIEHCRKRRHYVKGPCFTISLDRERYEHLRTRFDHLPPLREK